MADRASLKRGFLKRTERTVYPSRALARCLAAAGQALQTALSFAQKTIACPTVSRRLPECRLRGAVDRAHSRRGRHDQRRRPSRKRFHRAPRPESRDAGSCDRPPSAGWTARMLLSGQKRLVLMPRGAKISRWQKESSCSPAIFSTRYPRMMKPMSEYSARVPGAAVRGWRRHASIIARRSFVDSKRRTYPGRPEE